MRTLSNNEINQISGGEINWWRTGFDIAVGGLVGTIGGGIGGFFYGAAVEKGVLQPLSALAWLAPGALIGLGVGLVSGTTIAAIRETIQND